MTQNAPSLSSGHFDARTDAALDRLTQLHPKSIDLSLGRVERLLAKLGNPERQISLGEGMPTDPRITVGTEGDSSHRVIINQQGGGIISLEAPPGFQGSGMFYWRELFE